MFEHHPPYFGNALFGDRRAGQHARKPAVGRRGKEVKRSGVLDSRTLGFETVIAVGFVDGHAVEHFDDAALHALQLVARARQHQQQEEIRHRADRGFTLPYADRLHQDVAVPGGLAQQDGFAGAARHAAEVALRRRGTNEGALVHGEPLHAGLIAENAAAGNRARRIDAEHGHVLPTPGTPVMPTRSDLPVCGSRASNKCAASSPSDGRLLSITVMARARTVRSPPSTPWTYRSSGKRRGRGINGPLRRLVGQPILAPFVATTRDENASIRAATVRERSLICRLNGPISGDYRPLPDGRGSDGGVSTSGDGRFSV